VSRDLVVLACAVSAGIHAALASDHPSFAVAAALLGVLSAGLARRPSNALLDCAACVLAGLIGAYALAVTTGIPVVHPDVEPVTGLALATKAVEAAGLLAALYSKGTLTWRTRTHPVGFRSR
jgi:hypothetical protein